MTAEPVDSEHAAALHQGRIPGADEDAGSVSADGGAQGQDGPGGGVGNPGGPDGITRLDTIHARLAADFDEILVAANIIRHYSHSAAKYLRSRHRRGALPTLTKVRETRVPKGVVGVITPWNYPMALAIGDVIPALIAGNAVIHKPDTQTA